MLGMCGGRTGYVSGFVSTNTKYFHSSRRSKILLVPLATARSSLGGSQAGGLRLFRSVSQFVLAFFRQTCLLMLVLKYCCFRWFICIQPYVFEHSRPLACNIKLLLFYLCLELCCDIFSWVPDLDRTYLRVWLVYDCRGRHKLVSEPTASRLPLSNSLVEAN